MNEFIEKLIGRLEEYKYSHLIERDSEMLEHCKEKEMDCEGSDCFLCVWDKATEIVNQLAEEYNNGWISVDDRLPENISTVILQVKEIEKPTIGWYGNIEGWRLTEKDFVDLKEFTVLAWQPLPEPFKPIAE